MRDIDKTLRKLDTPAKIQDFLNLIPFNFEEERETYMSVSDSLRSNKAHCFEGALIAAAALAYHGHQPLLMDLKSSKKDVDHVVTLFKRGKHWGAISKTNHAVLRYREPIYKSVRELAMSYFHEYFLPSGTKTMISYSKPFNLDRFGSEWLLSKKNLFHIVDALDNSPHTKIIPKGLRLRRADPIEIRAGEITEYPSKRGRRGKRAP